MEKSNFQIALEEAGYDLSSYSGRGMFGKECLAVSFDGNVGTVVADVLVAFNEGSWDDEKVVLEEISDAFREMKTDSLGRASVAYFPRVSFVQSDEDEI